ncbi:MAG: TIGR03663 family protein, partial [Acidobacteria bacterium]|nr:TIGR03663 family protein [Acidobacteriota bacterium]
MSAHSQRVSPTYGSPLATVLFILLLLSGAALRLADLERRPLHGDEAVGASLSSKVSRTGSFVYESSNRHGPFQYLLGGLVMHWKGESTFWIRFPYSLAGSLLILACFGFRRPLGDFGWLLSCALLAFSPIFIYYSRYAVQEIHFLVATALLLSCGLAFTHDGRGIWLFGLLLSGAWMVTIKETFVIVWGCLAAALAISLVLGGREFRRSVSGAISRLKARPLAGVIGLLAGFLLVAMAYSDFFRDFSGPPRLAVNLASMLRHGASTADAVELHRHPAGLYLSLLLRFEWLTSALAAAGVWVGLRWRRPRTLLMSIYALLSLAVYCALSYKTPWLIMSPLLAMALVAGDGIGQLLSSRPLPISRGAGLVGACALPLLLLPQVFQTSYARPADPALGLAYHHAGEA